MGGDNVDPHVDFVAWISTLGIIILGSQNTRRKSLVN